MRLYGKFLGMHLRSQMQYKASFFMMFLGQFFTSFFAFFEIYFLLGRFHQVEGFTISQVLLCFSSVNISFALAEVFFRGFDRFPVILSNGEFDRILVRPQNTMFLVMVSQIDFSRLGRVVQAALVVIVAIPSSGVVWSLEKILCYLLMIVGGVGLFSGLFILYASISFFTTQGLEVMNIFTDGSRQYGMYPVSIYGRGILTFLTFVVPLALVQYYPLLFLLGRSSSPLAMVYPLFACLFLLPAYLVWRIGLRHYKSIGS